MDMAAAAIQQGAGVAVAVDFAANSAGIQQLQLGIAVALPVGFLLFQSFQLFMIHRDKQPAGAIVAGNLIALDALANNIAAFKHHAAEHFRRVRAVGFLDNVDIAAIGVN
ncbi:Uncharacterised protein [Klebsiella oxytoca]|nr:Uncharacterised protein [Klebsiella oxytoca]SBM25785.1 Uncharacterised protein [Klebsiella oxytoca]